MKKLESLTSSATSVTIAVFISRILGLVREQVLAYFFGAGKSMDAFVVAYRIPNLLRDLFAEGALGAAFVKVFASDLERKGKEESFKKAQILISNFLVIIGMIVFLGIIGAEIVVKLIAPEFSKDPEKFNLTINLARMMMPFLLFISLSSILAGMLNTFRVFFLPALSSGLFNLTSILIGVTGYFICMTLGLDPIYAMAVGVTLGGGLQFCFQYPLVKKKGFVFSFRPSFNDESFREVLKLMFPVIFGFSAVQINVFINTYFATSCGEGAVSWYSYAFRIMYVPLGLFGVGLAQALLPELTRSLSKKDLTTARDIYSRVLIVSLSLSIPSAIGLYILSEPIVKLLFERGKFTHIDTFYTSEILKILALALPFYGLSKVAVPLFYSLGKTFIPALGSFVAVFFNVIIIFLTIDSLGIKGVALGTSGSLFFQCLFLLSISFYFVKRPVFSFILRSLLTLMIASTGLIIGVTFIESYFLNSVITVIVSVILGAFIFIGICRVLGPKETYIFYYKLFKK